MIRFALARATRRLELSCSLCVLPFLLTLGCSRRVEEPEPRKVEEATEKRVEVKQAVPREVTRDKADDNGDPLGGKFSLADATMGLPEKGTLTATMKTTKGTLECELFEDKAPITVANFVGLARGLRPFRDPQKNWVKKPAYDGTTFHRVIKGFMIQGGDPEGTGRGEPGYVIPDEVWPGATHNERGLLCMANRGPNTNGMQFFIMDGSAPHLDRSYTIFGKCSPGSVIEAIADSKVSGDRAIDPVKIEKVTVTRR